MKPDLTVVYYSSNREDPAFEGKIQQSLREAMGDLPLISVTQKPTDFGKNICVGDVGRSGNNVFRQYQIGVQEATTKYVCPAESDALYPREFFRFRPSSDHRMFRAVPIYMAFPSGTWAGKFWPKNHWEAATIVNRDYVLQKLDELLPPLPVWRDGVEEGPERGLDHPCLFTICKLARFRLPAAAISFHTRNQMHKKACFKPKDAVDSLPRWGTPAELIGKYFS